jgi:hypothetical protein
MGRRASSRKSTCACLRRPPAPRSRAGRDANFMPGPKRWRWSLSQRQLAGFIGAAGVDGKDRLALLLRKHRSFGDGEAHAGHDDEDRIAVGYMRKYIVVWIEAATGPHQAEVGLFVRRRPGIPHSIYGGRPWQVGSQAKSLCKISPARSYGYVESVAGQRFNHRVRGPFSGSDFDFLEPL